jgi:hypothetical protein
VHLLARRIRELVRIREFQCDLRAAIVEQHVPWLFTVLEPEISDRHRRKGDQPELGDELLDNGSPGCFLRGGQGAFRGVERDRVSRPVRRVAPKLGAAARTDRYPLPKLRRQTHDDALLDIFDALAGNQDQHDPVIQQSRERLQHAGFGRAIKIGHRLVDIGQSETEFVIPAYPARQCHFQSPASVKPGLISARAPTLSSRAAPQLCPNRTIISTMMIAQGRHSCADEERREQQAAATT